MKKLVIFFGSLSLALLFGVQLGMNYTLSKNSETYKNALNLLTNQQELITQQNELLDKQNNIIKTFLNATDSAELNKYLEKPTMKSVITTCAPTQLL